VNFLTNSKNALDVVLLDYNLYINHLNSEHQLATAIMPQFILALFMLLVGQGKVCNKKCDCILTKKFCD